MLVHNTIGRGTFDRAHSLGRHLVRKGHHVTLFAGASAPAAARGHSMNGVEVIEAFDPFPSRVRESGLSPFDLLNRIRCLKSQPCDLIHCFDHRLAVSLPGLMLSRTRKIPCIFDWADLWGREGIAGERRSLGRLSLGSIDHFLEERVRRGAHGLTVINTALRDRAAQRFDVPIHLLPVGANSDLITPLPKQAMRRRFGLPENAAIALHTGLAPYDMRYLAEAFVLLAKQQPKALLVMAGRHFPIVAQVVAAAGFSDRLIWLGMQDREGLTAAMGSADVLVLPYTNRSVNSFRYPNKLGDYLSAGRPVVTNRTGDLGQLVVDEQVGLAVEDTPEAFALAMKTLLDNGKLADEMGRRSREVAETKLDWGFLAAGLDRFYHETLGRYR